MTTLNVLGIFLMNLTARKFLLGENLNNQTNGVDHSAGPHFELEKAEVGGHSARFRGRSKISLGSKIRLACMV